MKALSKLSTAIGDGLVAGFLGTAAMTVSSTLEARVRQRKPSSAPARATAKALGIDISWHPSGPISSFSLRRSRLWGSLLR